MKNRVESCITMVSSTEDCPASSVYLSPGGPPWCQPRPTCAQTGGPAGPPGQAPGGRSPGGQGSPAPAALGRTALSLGGAARLEREGGGMDKVRGGQGVEEGGRGQVSTRGLRSVCSLSILIDLRIHLIWITTQNPSVPRHGRGPVQQHLQSGLQLQLAVQTPSRNLLQLRGCRLQSPQVRLGVGLW